MFILRVSIVALLVLSLFGCGSRDGSTVIQPTQSYQPTAEEQAMQREMDAARESQVQ